MITNGTVILYYYKYDEDNFWIVGKNTKKCIFHRKIYLCDITAKFPYKEIQKTILGATDSVDWEYCTTTLEPMEKLQGYSIFSVEQTQNSVMLDEFEIDKSRYYNTVLSIL